MLFYWLYGLWNDFDSAEEYQGIICFIADPWWCRINLSTENDVCLCWEIVNILINQMG